MNQTRNEKKKLYPFGILSACFLLLLSPMMGCSSNESPASIPQGSDAQTETQNIGGYKTANIGGVVWMAENLNIETDGSYCYNDVPDNCSIYGRLYTYEAAQTACPDGWHLATADEWDFLNNTVGTNSSASYYLKSTAGWWTDVGNGNDAYGFTALPGGIRNIDGVYSDLTLAGYFWAEASIDGNSASYELHYNTSNLAKQTKISEETAMSVRCVYDETKISSCGGTFYDPKIQSCCFQANPEYEGSVYDPETQYCVEHGPSEKTIVDKKDVVVEGRVNCTIVNPQDPQISYGTATGAWCSVVIGGNQWAFQLCFGRGEYKTSGSPCDVDFCLPYETPTSKFSCTPAP